MNWYLNKTNLADGNYSFKVYGNDTSNNWNATETRVVEINTTIPDTTPPVITNVNVTDITNDYARITWDTDEISDSLVKYGTESGNYTLSAFNTSFVLEHRVDLTGLSENTTYYFVVNSTDTNGNSAQGAEYSFTTVVTPTPTPTPIPTTVNETEYLNSISQPIDISKIRFVLNTVNEEWVKGSKWPGRPMELMYWQKSAKYLIEIDIDENGYVTHVGFRRWGKPVTKIPYDLAVRSLDKLGFTTMPLDGDNVSFKVKRALIHS
jgi:hypothetical protein